jgi:hypothetical protein
MSASLLIDEPPCQYLPSLARALGDPVQAIVLQQLHYRLGMATKEYGGYRWVYNSYERWGDELGLSGDLVRRKLEKLRGRQLVVAIPNPYVKFDKMLWYRIDYDGDALKSLCQFDEAESPDRLANSPDRYGGPASSARRSRQCNTKRRHTRDDFQRRLPENDDEPERLVKFCDARLEAGVGRAEYYDDDLAKELWREAFEDLQCSEEEFDLALGEAMRRTDADWRKRLTGPKAAQAFVGEFDRLLPSVTIRKSRAKRRRAEEAVAC